MIKQTLAASAFATGLLLAGAAVAQTPAPMNQPMANSSGWHHARQGNRSAEHAGHLYTDALNTLYAHGFHGVHRMGLRGGDIVATAVTPNGRMRHVTVHPYTHQIHLGVG